ncbi:MAG: hypothetical protein R2844_15505 [Caldilineales bacterium]
MKKPIEPEKTLRQAVSSIKSITSPPSEPKQPINDDEFKPACQFVAQVAVQAHSYGASYVRLNEFLAQLPHLFGFKGQMLAAAPFAFFEFQQSAGAEPYRLTYRLPATSFELTKLST